MKLFLVLFCFVFSLAHAHQIKCQGLDRPQVSWPIVIETRSLEGIFYDENGAALLEAVDLGPQEQIIFESNNLHFYLNLENLRGTLVQNLGRRYEAQYEYQCQEIK